MQNSTSVVRIRFDRLLKTNVGGIGVTGPVEPFPHDRIVGGRRAFRKAIRDPLLRGGA